MTGLGDFRQIRDFPINHHPKPAIQDARGELKRERCLWTFIGDRSNPRRTRSRRGSQCEVHRPWTARSWAPHSIRSPGLSRRSSTLQSVSNGLRPESVEFHSGADDAIANQAHIALSCFLFQFATDIIHSRGGCDDRMARLFMGKSLIDLLLATLREANYGSAQPARDCSLPCGKRTTTSLREQSRSV